MNLHCRELLHVLLVAAAGSLGSATLLAQTYPQRPVHMIVGFPAGSSPDITARLIGQHLSEHLRQPFIVDNRPGAGSTLAAETVARAQPDGYTILLASVANAVNATFYEKLNYNFIRDLAPVAGLIRAGYVMEINPSVPARTVSEFIAYAKAHPGMINMASAGNGTAPHIAGELFKMMAHVDLVHVPYKGDAPAITDLLSGQVQVYFGAPSASIAHIRSGKLRALAVTSLTRSDALPDIPTVNEYVTGYEASGWLGVCTPRNASEDIIQRLNNAINAALVDPNVKTRIAAFGNTVMMGSPADFGRHIADETEKWGKVVRSAGIRAD